MQLTDITLSRRLERCEAQANVSLVESRSRLEPDLGATWMERAGAFAMFDGVGSPLTQTFALGVFATPSEDDLAAIERFYEERGAEVFHEVSPLAPPETMALLVARDYRPVELTTIMFRELNGELPPARADVQTRIAGPDEVELWAETAAEGWSEYAELSTFMHNMARTSAASHGVTSFFAELDGRPVATGALVIHEGVALLAGASTIPSARNRGAQRALLEARLRHAANQGCDLAMMGASPGSTSQKNAERQGFRIAYTRIKWG